MNDLMEAPVTTQEQSLLRTDRCDACTARACVKVELATGELMFCGHHWSKHKESIEKIALNIIDETSFIN